jgi:hypothetical protein
VNITDTIDNLAAAVHAGANIDEAIDAYINTASFEVHTEILEEIGDRDLSEPAPDLTRGWREIRAQLAYNALHGAVASATEELRTEQCRTCGGSGEREVYPWIDEVCPLCGGKGERS